MPRNFRPEDREQSLLFPPSVEDYLPDDHPARYIRDVVEHLHDEGRLEVFYADYRDDGRGGAAYHPRMMLSVLLHAYSRGVTSSRKIELACVENLGFRYLTANQCPDHRAIASFRKRHLKAFEELFREVLRLCHEAGLVRLGRVAIDGRRVKGNASKSKTLTEQALDEQIETLSREILEEAERTDAAEDEDLGERAGDKLPPGFKKKLDRLQRLKEASKELEKRKQAKRAKYDAKLEARAQFERDTGEKKRGPKPKPPQVDRTRRGNPLRVNTTDPESRLMKTRNGFKQGYNGQVAVDAHRNVIVACDVTQDSNDSQQLEPMLEAIEANLSRSPKQAVADAGYWSVENADLEETTGVELFLATQKDSRQRAAGKKALDRGRIPKSATSKQRMERRLRTKRGKQAYRCRGHVAETPFAQMENGQLRAFLLRGLEAVRAEWNLWCTVLNLAKLRSKAHLVLG